MVLSAVIGIVLFIILFFLALIKVTIWSCLYKFQRYLIDEKDIAKAVLQMSDGSPKKYFESLVVLYEIIYDDCSECETICQGIVQTLLHAQAMHDPTSYEEIEDILKQVSLGLEMINITDLPITRELLLSLQATPTNLQNDSKEDVKESTVRWLWGCTIYGGALSKCPHNKLSFHEDVQHQAFNPQMSSAKYNAPPKKSRVFTSSKFVLTTSTKQLAQTRVNNPKKGCRSLSKRKMTKEWR